MAVVGKEEGGGGGKRKMRYVKRKRDAKGKV